MTDDDQQQARDALARDLEQLGYVTWDQETHTATLTDKATTEPLPPLIRLCVEVVGAPPPVLTPQEKAARARQAAKDGGDTDG